MLAYKHFKLPRKYMVSVCLTIFGTEIVANY